MATSPKSTLLLDVAKWDLTLDLYGNLAIARPPYAVAQDCASRCRYFLGDNYYDASDGIPYFQQVLGHWPPLSLYRSYLVNAAMITPGVAMVTVFFAGLAGRALSGQVQETDTGGNTAAANF